MVFTDGGCLGNPGIGGWAYIIVEEGKEIGIDSGAEKETTNNKMELTAVINSLKALKGISHLLAKIEINTDSQYVKNGITLWILNWKKNGWKTANKSPVKNRELWEELDSLAMQMPVTWKWVKGHSGVELNEKCDNFVHSAIKELLNEN